MTDDDLAVIRARRAAITPGPRVIRDDPHVPLVYVDLPDGGCISFDTERPSADATFDAAAPTDIDTLLAEVTRLQAELRTAKIAWFDAKFPNHSEI